MGNLPVVEKNSEARITDVYRGEDGGIVVVIEEVEDIDEAGKQDALYEATIRLNIELIQMHDFRNHILKQMIKHTKNSGNNIDLLVGLTEVLCKVLRKRYTMMQARLVKEIGGLDGAAMIFPDDFDLFLNNFKDYLSEKAGKLEAFVSNHDGYRELPIDEKVLLDTQLQIQKALVTAISGQLLVNK